MSKLALFAMALALLSALMLLASGLGNRWGLWEYRMAFRLLGWEIDGAVPEEGRIEATDTTLFFGFKDDIVVRITRTAAGSRVDVRSASRVGRSDLGTNARRVRAFLRAVAQG